MTSFVGFPDGKVGYTRIPGLFFTDLLPKIDHLGELKVSLYAIWYLDKQEGKYRYISFHDFTSDRLLMEGFGKDKRKALLDALERAVLRGTFLKTQPKDSDKNEEAIFFLNTPRGRAAVKAIEQGSWSPLQEAHAPAELEHERPNIFRLYEENIGPLTPMISEDLNEAEQTYPMEWIEDAIRIAVRNNVRRWQYAEAILRSWKKEGRDDTYRGTSEEDRQSYVKGELSDFIQH